MDRRAFIKGLVTASIAAPVAAATSRLTGKNGCTPTPATHTPMAKQRLRCSYIVAPPYISRDPNTGELSGLFYDLTMKLGTLAACEIVWENETTYATFAEDLNRGRCDLFAGGLWPNAQRARVADFSMPAFYSGVGLYVRASDTRFDSDITLLNNPAYRIATIDGEMSQLISQSDFPKASNLELPNTTDLSFLAESVRFGKADATFLQKNVASLYLREHKDTLRNLADAHPLRVFGNVWALPYHEAPLKGMINAALEEMINMGIIDQILNKHENGDKGYYRPKRAV